MPPKPVPQALPIRCALDQSTSLARLVQRLQESNARFEAVRELLPKPMRTLVRAGPVDEEGWSLLVANAAAAAKLRHLLPLLDQALRDGGWPPTPIRLKIIA